MVKQNSEDLRTEEGELTLEHVNAGLGRVSHGIHEDWWQELGHDDAHLGTHEFIGENLGKEFCRLFPHVWIGGVTV